MSPLFIAVFTIHVVLLNIKCSQLSKPKAWSLEEWCCKFSFDHRSKLHFKLL